MSRPKAIVCVTGSELTRGETRDLNGPYLGTELTTLGVDVRSILLLPDDPLELARGFRDAMERADIVLASGGLGPTADDHTVATVASLVGRRVIRDAEAETRMRERALARFRRIEDLPDNFFKQAEVVEGATVLRNPVGLAPGSLLETDRGFLAILPGVPREMQAMYRESVAPEIVSRFLLEPPRIYRAKLLQVPESMAEDRIQSLGIDMSRVEYGISARPGEILLKFLSHRQSDHPYLDEIRGKLDAEFGDSLVPLVEGLLDASGLPVEVDTTAIVHERLLASGLTVATAESCTGGVLARTLTDHAGSSAYFLGSVVAYQDAIKERLLGVPAALLRAHGAVSEPVCSAMAGGALRVLGSDLAVAITGIAGPGGGSAEKPVGLVYIGLGRAAPATRGKATPSIRVERHVFFGDRRLVRRQAVLRSLNLIRLALERTADRANPTG